MIESVKANQLQGVVDQINQAAGYQAVSFTSNNADLVDRIVLGSLASSQSADPAAVAAAFGSALVCSVQQIVVEQPELVAVLPKLGLARLTLSLDFAAAALDADPEALAVLGSMENLTDVMVRGDLTVDLLPQIDAVTSLTLAAEPAVDPDFGVIAEHFPAVTTLVVTIDQDAAWQVQDLAALGSLEAIVFTLDMDLITSGAGLREVSSPTLDLIVQTPDVLPNLLTLNGLPVTELTPDNLGAGGAKTQAEREAGQLEQDAIMQLEAWGQDIVDSGWPMGGSADSIAGPVLILGGEDSPVEGLQVVAGSAVRGVRGEDWRGVPAAQLCQSEEQCRSVIVVEHLLGANTGIYYPAVGNDAAFPAYKGETAVTVYDLASGQVRPRQVVAVTDPPDTATRQSKGIGLPDFDAAAAYISARIAMD